MNDEAYQAWVVLRMRCADHYIKGKRIERLARLCPLKVDKDCVKVLRDSINATLEAMKWITT